MPNYCVVGGCRNVARKELGISTYYFPKNSVIRRAWVRFVNQTRADFRGPGPGSIVCSRHFKDSCFEVPSQSVLDCRQEAMFNTSNRRKKGTAVPSICFPDKVQTKDPRPSASMEKREHKQIIEEMLKMECEDVEEESIESESMEEPFMPEVPVVSSTPVDVPPVKTYRSIGVQADIKPSSRVKWTNCRMRSSVRSKGIQCNVFNSSIRTSTPVKAPPKLSLLLEDCDSDNEQSQMEHSEETDTMWKLETSYDTSYDVDKTITEDLEEPETKKRMFAVTEDQLLQLFRRCHQCGLGGASGMVTSVDGTLVRVEQTCLACEEEMFVWKGQQMTGKYPAGNISLSAAILCAGALPGQTLRVLKFWGLEAIAPVTYFAHQKKFLHQAGRNVWQVQQQIAIEKIQDVVLLSGDSRCDSMGHCAKYGSYTLHDTTENKIVCTELIQSTEVKSSYHMELEGLSRALDVVEAAHPETKIKLTTDGHKSVAKSLREKKADRVTHHLDIWHVSKGLWKKLLGLSKTFPLVGRWMKSIRSHLYWCALSSDGDAEIMVAKWKSIVNHIANVHEHDDVDFPTCAHGKIHREWFNQASEEYDKVSKILLATQLLHSVAKLSPDGQTSGLEGFHGTVIHFAPKMIHFGYNGMKTRTQIAALHFNENAGREQRVTKDGKPSEALHFPKSKKGEYVVKEVKINPTYSYADKIAAEVESLVLSGKTYEIKESPPALCATYTHPDKNEAVAKRRAHRRYRKNITRMNPGLCS